MISCFLQIPCAGISVFASFVKDEAGELHSCGGVDFMPPGLTPSNELIRINYDGDNIDAASFHLLHRVLRVAQPLIESHMCRLGIKLPIAVESLPCEPGANVDKISHDEAPQLVALRQE